MRLFALIVHPLVFLFNKTMGYINFNEGGFFSEKYTISVLKRCISLFFLNVIY